jgi:four helix bundle protein
MEGMGSVRQFEDLWIWQEARKLVSDIYSDFNSGYGSKDFGFRDQIQRAGISIMNNIAEGFERGTDPDFAKASCGEVRSMYYTAEDLQYTKPEQAEDRRLRTRKLSAGIFKLADHLRGQP